VAIRLRHEANVVETTLKPVSASVRGSYGDRDRPRRHAAFDGDTRPSHHPRRVVPLCAGLVDSAREQALRAIVSAGGERQSRRRTYSSAR
jgi:hypothetical protein